MYVCVSVHANPQVHVYVHVEAREHPILILRCCPPCFRVTGSLIDLTFPRRLGWMVSEPQEFSHLWLPVVRVTALCYHPQLFPLEPGF